MTVNETTKKLVRERAKFLIRKGLALRFTLT
ncbi:MAG: hypothetical protein RLZZ184_757 [Cyanobacteriota bacterium]|jgi:hypothetical protein